LLQFFTISLPSQKLVFPDPLKLVLFFESLPSFCLAEARPMLANTLFLSFAPDGPPVRGANDLPILFLVDPRPLVFVASEVSLPCKSFF